MITEKISQIATGQIYIKCKPRKLFKLNDNHINCSFCNTRYSLKQLSFYL